MFNQLNWYKYRFIQEFHELRRVIADWMYPSPITRKQALKEATQNKGLELFIGDGVERVATECLNRTVISSNDMKKFIIISSVMANHGVRPDQVIDQLHVSIQIEIANLVLELD